MGMSRKTPNTVGEKWNSWTILEEVGNTSSGHLKVLAKCNCGTIKEVYYHKLKRGTSKSCGKCNKIQVEQNDKFNRWTVLGNSPIKKDSQNYWLCQCECGNKKYINEYKLSHGLIKSCGCLSRELASERLKIHGKSHTHIFREWEHMRRRCFPNAECKGRYYARGIKVCEEWQNSFQSFYDYVSKLDHFDEKGYSLDRINNFGNYEPGNVRWATVKEQSRNRENSIYVTYKGEEVLLCEIVEKLGLKYQKVWARLKRGWSADLAIDTP